jgi:hypothetical protein
VPLETYETPEQLYLARGADVNPLRPAMTGDIYDDVEIPGVDDRGLGAVASHPCAMRKGAQINDRVLMCRVRPSIAIPSATWPKGYYDKMPFPDVIAVGTLHVAHLDEIGLSPRECIDPSRRTACLLPFGINLLQQRLVWHMTRCAVPTSTFQEAIEHTLVEADLQEEWQDELCAVGVTVEDAGAGFEQFMRETGASCHDVRRDAFAVGKRLAEAITGIGVRARVARAAHHS